MIQTHALIKFSPKVKQYLLAHLIFFIILLTLVFSMIDIENIVRNFLLIAVILGIPAYAFIVLVYNHWSYIINDNDITINSGIIFKKSKTISLKAIQNINQKRGPIMRLFDIVSVEIWTASVSQMNVTSGKTMNSPDGVIMIGEEEAKELQEYVNTYRNGDR